MRRVAVFVDAGYFWVQATNIILGEKSQRNQLSVDYDSLRVGLIAQTNEQFADADLLRVYWYDGPGPEGKTPDHRSIEELNDFKLRLGTRNGAGAQKAVDGLIIADMIGLAQSKAISDALLVSGDADLTPGVIAAQNLGIRVHLLSIGSLAATSPYLKSEVDYKHHWSDAAVRSFAAPLPQDETTRPPESDSDNLTKKFQEVAKSVLAKTDKNILAGLKPKDPIPREIDSELLQKARDVVGQSLTEDQKRELRAGFKKLI
jgi:uncharacterized LabA/DUF88 family protein